MKQPEYQSYWQSILEWNSIFMFVPMMLGIVGVSLLIAHLILKKKKKLIQDVLFPLLLEKEYLERDEFNELMGE